MADGAGEGGLSPSHPLTLSPSLSPPSPHHPNMRYAVLQIFLPDRLESEGRIKSDEVGLCGDLNGGLPVQAFDISYRFGHQFPPVPEPARLRGSNHPADGNVPFVG